MATRATPQSHTHPSALGSGPRVTVPRWRIHVILVVTLLLVARVVLRLGELQIVRHDELSTQARREIDQTHVLMPQRGTITDRAGNVLAMDVDRESLWVIPAQIDQERAPRLALTLSALLNKDSGEILAALTNPDVYWQPVARWLEPEVAAQIVALNEPGLHMEYEPRRVYPQGEFAAPVVGAVNFNGDGISGVEGFYNTALKGITGTLRAEFDGAKNPIAIAPQQTLPPRDGVDITLTLDPYVQYVIEKELKESVQAHSADGGSIIVFDPQTGAIRGMASWPLFDPNRYYEYPEEVYTNNPAVNSLYEPGSTFKMITAAAGMQVRAFTADTLVNDTGVIFRHNESLSNWNGGANGMLDPGKMLYFSSNVAALQFNELTGPERFYDAVKAFGFGKPTGVEMGGEQAGLVHRPGTPYYNEMLLLTNAYGQGIAVTPLQMVQAAGAIANDGVMMKPYIVERRCDGDSCTTTQPQENGRPIEPGVAWTVRRMLVNSANHYAGVVWGERTGDYYGDQWLVPGYQVAAKTGTSSIPIPGGGYDPSYTIGSVLGFGPAEDARFVVLVKIDRPKDDIWGVGTAIPVFYKVMDQLLRHERIPPDPGLVSPGQTL
jgi:cell division protein FtsI (penicillin-binding protein 3)